MRRLRSTITWTSGFTEERSRTAYSAVTANFQMRFDLQVINSVRGGWKMAVKFSKPVAEIFNINKARFASGSQDRRTFYIENVPGQIQNANLKQCERINVEFAGKMGSSPANKTLSAFVMFERKEPEYSEIDPPGTCPTVPHLEWNDNRSHLNPTITVSSNEVNLKGDKWQQIKCALCYPVYIKRIM